MAPMFLKKKTQKVKKKKVTKPKEPLFEVSLDDIDNEVPEPKESELDNSDLAVNIILLPLPPDWQIVSRSRDPFVLPDYWMVKGYKA